MARLTMKFGGTSVGSPAAIAQVLEIVSDHLAGGRQLAVVVSAMSGVTDALLESASAAAEGDRDAYAAINTKIADKHHAVIDALIASQSARDAIRAEVDDLLRGHLELCEAASILGEATPRISDALVSYGERLSSRVIAAVMAYEGLLVKQVDSNDFIVTNNVFQNADPLWDETEARIADGLLPELNQGVTPIITGFIGATPDGTLTTLGRGGSDFSAAIFAACLGSDELMIWTDVDGVMTADPQLDARARVLPYVSYQEIGELAFYGAKVLHPKTVQPIIARDIPLRVRNTFNPAHTGTVVGSRAQASETVIKAVTGIRDVSMLTVSGPGMLGVPGIAGRTFLATANAGASILMISQASSEQSFCFTVVDPLAHNVKAAVESELRREIQHNDINSVEVLSEIVIITVVGAGMRGTPGVAGRVFSLLGEQRINVLAIAQGSSECSISFIIAENDLERAVGELHSLALETVENDRVNGLASSY
ncbi:MAG: aspartate kinase [Chloroflexi bacterium]|nr:aspartate kinase [Chloroflexota bacterium]